MVVRLALSKRGLEDQRQPRARSSAFTPPRVAENLGLGGHDAGPGDQQELLTVPHAMPAEGCDRVTLRCLRRRRAWTDPSRGGPRRDGGASGSLARSAVEQSGLDEAGEERVRRGRAALELGVELAADEVRVVGQLDHLDQVQVGVDAREAPARLPRAARGSRCSPRSGGGGAR